MIIYQCSDCGRIIQPDRPFHVLTEVFYDKDQNDYSRTQDLEFYCKDCSDKRALLPEKNKQLRIELENIKQHFDGVREKLVALRDAIDEHTKGLINF